MTLPKTLCVENVMRNRIQRASITVTSKGTFKFWKLIFPQWWRISWRVAVALWGKTSLFWDNESYTFPRAREWAVRANEWMDKRVAQKLRPDSWLFCPTVRRISILVSFFLSRPFHSKTFSSHLSFSGLDKTEETWKIEYGTVVQKKCHTGFIIYYPGVMQVSCKG